MFGFRFSPLLIACALGGGLFGCAAPAQVAGAYTGYIGPPYGQKRGVHLEVQQAGSDLTGQATLSDQNGRLGMVKHEGAVTGKMSGDKVTCKLSLDGITYEGSGVYATDGEEGPRLYGLIHMVGDGKKADDLPFLWKKDASSTPAPK